MGSFSVIPVGNPIHNPQSKKVCKDRISEAVWGGIVQHNLFRKEIPDGVSGIVLAYRPKLLNIFKNEWHNGRLGSNGNGPMEFPPSAHADFLARH